MFWVYIGCGATLTLAAWLWVWNGGTPDDIDTDDDDEPFVDKRYLRVIVLVPMRRRKGARN